MDDNLDFTPLRNELRDIIRSFNLNTEAQRIHEGVEVANALNIYVFGPQGSGKTSFIRTCYRAMMDELPKEIEDLEISLHRTTDGTSLYSVYQLTKSIRLHDTRGQREFTPEEIEQLKLVLEGRAKPNSLIKQRKRYWLLLREFWRTEDRMKRTFSKKIMREDGCLDTEPHFVFLVVDPNQQELLLEDQDFQSHYSDLLADLKAREVPFAVLCTHGDKMTESMRRGIQKLPAILGIANADNPQSGALENAPKKDRKEETSYAEAASLLRSSQPAQPDAPSPLPDPFRVVTNYTLPSPDSFKKRGLSLNQNATPPDRYPPTHPKPPLCPPSLYSSNPAGVAPRNAMAEAGNVQKNSAQGDIQTLLVLLDAVRQADFHVQQRMAGARPKPAKNAEDLDCTIL